MKTQFKVTESLNGWSRLETTFVVESSPRWWQFWKPKVMHQEFNGSVWVKGEVSQSFAPVVETFKTKEKCTCKSAQFTREVTEDFEPMCGRCGRPI
jgi:hypothetical protein